MADISAASLAARAAQLRSQGAVMDRPKSHFKVSAKHLSKRRSHDFENERDRAWWIEYEAQNR